MAKNKFTDACSDRMKKASGSKSQTVIMRTRPDSLANEELSTFDQAFRDVQMATRPAEVLRHATRIQKMTIKRYGQDRISSKTCATAELQLTGNS